MEECHGTEGKWNTDIRESLNVDNQPHHSPLPSTLKYTDFRRPDLG